MQLRLSKGRQHPIGRFVLDFYCPTERLAVEVDGSAHDSTRDADAERQQILESLGITFVRLTAALVETDLPAALALIAQAVQHTPISPLSRTSGEGPGVRAQTTLSLGRERLGPQVRGEGISPLPRFGGPVRRGGGARGEDSGVKAAPHLSPLPRFGRGAGGEAIRYTCPTKHPRRIPCPTSKTSLTRPGAASPT